LVVVFEFKLLDSIRVTGLSAGGGTTSTLVKAGAAGSSTKSLTGSEMMIDGGGGGGGGSGATGAIGAIGAGADGAKGAIGDNGEGAPPNGAPGGLETGGGIRVPHLIQNFAVSNTSAEQLGHFLVMAIPSIFITKFYHLAHQKIERDDHRKR
jgi:hypothetical protein